MLLYTARVQFGPSAVGTSDKAEHLRMRLVARPGQAPVILVTFGGRPVQGAVVKLFPEEGEPVELKSDAEGRVEHALVANDRTAFLGKRRFRRLSSRYWTGWD